MNIIALVRLALAIWAYLGPIINDPAFKDLWSQLLAIFTGKTITSHPEAMGHAMTAVADCPAVASIIK